MLPLFELGEQFKSIESVARLAEIRHAITLVDSMLLKERARIIETM